MVSMYALFEEENGIIKFPAIVAKDMIMYFEPDGEGFFTTVEGISNFIGIEYDGHVFYNCNYRKKLLDSVKTENAAKETPSYMG